MTITIKAEYFGVTAAADYLGVTRKTIIRWCDTGVLDHFEIPAGKYHKRIISADALEAFLKRMNKPADANPRKRGAGRPPIYRDAVTP